MGAIRDVALDLTPEAQVGDYVLVHAGFAIEVVDEQYAADTLELIKAMSELVDDPLFSEGAVAR
jgi:hydrogenase expression/formation protein HypC